MPTRRQSSRRDRRDLRFGSCKTRVAESVKENTPIHQTDSAPKNNKSVIFNIVFILKYSRRRTSKLYLGEMLFEDPSYLGGRPEGEEQDDGELLVFGYGCRLFRDDEAARKVNRGETLIPWQGDKSLMIDRYMN